MRLFAALPLSAEAVERLLRLRLRLSHPGDGLRWSNPEQWHITLQFYGEVDEARAACLAQSCAQMAKVAAPVLTLSGLARFAAKGILYADVDTTPEMQTLHDRIAAAGSVCGVAPERRAFHPHITLARSKGPVGLRTLQSLCTPEMPAFGPDVRWTASECLLVRSTLRPQGAEYETYARLALAPALEQPQMAS